MVKKIKIIFIWICVFFLLFFFIYFTYKKIQTGKNINGKSKYDVVKQFMQIQSYEAIIHVTVQSKKSTNQYDLKQYYLKPNYAKQIVIEPFNIANLETIYNGNTLTIRNSNLGLTKIYANYPFINENKMWLSSFLTGDIEQMQMIENEEEIIIKTNDNPYSYLKILYIHKKTNLPTKMEIIDNSTQTKVYIEYKEIKLNTIQENYIFAFQTVNDVKEVSF